jgi:16S rRNA U516 pseudouridylate synthase RsuA-like enzyme
MLRLVEIAIGSVLIGELHPGEWRETTFAEVDRLKRNLEKTRDSLRSVPHG